MLMRKLAAALACLTAAPALTTAPAAAARSGDDSYAYWKHGYFFADTGYPGNMPGVYATTVSRYDAFRGVLYVSIRAQDKKCDKRHAAVMIRGWDQQLISWVYFDWGYVPRPCNGVATGSFSIPVRNFGIDTVIVKDGIWAGTGVGTYSPGQRIIWTRTAAS
jgi:hypothetical protein